ncbi:MAG TPA: DegT/DnrJ/EryC1/StrS family aminotransferase [Gemmatimonadaceae bacterium]|nr:DegT/DnrJ/EryC1/StrS family aminotransferase [Gemmatimonadaceae bacterium]
MAAILRGLGVRAGDDVLIQAFTCIAVPEAVLSLGARPRYVDVTLGSPNMDPDDLARKIRPDTKAVVIQHSFGLPADVNNLCRIASSAEIPVVEDCAHTIASAVGGRRVGSFGAGAFYSYEASKPVFVGIGGSAVANDPTLRDALASSYPQYAVPAASTQLQLLAMFLAHRIAYRPSTYWTVRSLFRAVVKAGLIKGNYNKVEDSSGPARDFSTRMGARQNRMLTNALRRLEAQTSHRRWVADQYRARIRNPSVTHTPLDAGVEPVFGRYPMIVENKPDWIDGARTARVELADVYSTPVHPLEGDALRRVGYEPRSCPNAEWIAARVVSLPTGPQVDERQVDRAVDYFNR